MPFSSLPSSPLLLALLLGCEPSGSSASPAPTPVTSQAGTDRMQFFVQTPEDMGLPLAQAVEAARASGELEVVLPAGETIEADIVIRDTAKQPTLRVTIRSDGVPAVLHGGRIDIRAQHITLENVQLRDYTGEKTAMRLAVGTSATLRKVTLANLRIQGRAQQPAIVFEGLKKNGPKTLTIEDSWIVDNHVPDGAMVLIDATPRDPFTRLTLRRVGLLRNDVQTDIFAYALQHLELDGTAVIEPTAQSLLWCGWPENTVSVTDSRMVLKHPGSWLRRDSNPPSQTPFQAPELMRSTVEASTPTLAEAAGPAGTVPRLSDVLGHTSPD